MGLILDSNSYFKIAWILDSNFKIGEILDTDLGLQGPNGGVHLYSFMSIGDMFERYIQFNQSLTLNCDSCLTIN